jgi:hypothetical protein
MATAISLANGKVNSYCRSFHLDVPFLLFKLIEKSILAHRCRLAYATGGLWEVLFIVIGRLLLDGLQQCLLPPFANSSVNSQGDESERQLIENRYSPFASKH